MKHNPRRRQLIVKRFDPKTSHQVWLEHFLKYLTDELQESDNTIQAYRRDMVKFFRWLAGRSLQHLNVTILADYVDFLYQLKLAPSSIARHIVSLRVFFRFLQLEGAVVDNPAELLGSQKLWERMPVVLSPGQVDALLAAPNEAEDRLWQRDRAILEFFYATGCRVSELVNMQIQDVHDAEGYCLCTGKGNKQRLVPLGKRAIAAYYAWMAKERFEVEERHQKGTQPPQQSLSTTALKTNWVFLSFKGYKIRREALWELIKKYALRIGAPTHITPHTMRHSFATHLLAGGADLRLVQEMLGHATIATTQIYTHVDMSHLKAVHHKFHPRG